VPGDAQNRLGDIGEYVIETIRQRTEQLPPALAVDAETFSGAIDRFIQERGGAIVERMRAVDLAAQPLQSV